MPRMSKREKEEWQFFLNDRGRLQYSEKCAGCSHECKQSFRAEIVSCSKYRSKRAVRE